MAKRDKFIKIMLTERELKKINRYAGYAFQSKSEFIRSAIRRRIAEINNSIYPKLPPSDPEVDTRHLRRSVMGELRGALNEFKDGVLLEKPDERELKTREDEKLQRKEELEEIKQALEKQE